MPTFLKIELQTTSESKVSKLASILHKVKTLSYDDIITLRRPKVGT